MVAFIAFAISFPLFAQQPQSRGRVIVRQFANGRGISTESARTVTNLIRSRIGASGAVRLVTRDDADFDRILTEHHFQNSSWSSAEKTAEFGKAVNADYILMGEIDEMDGEIVVTARMIDLQSAEQIASTDIQFARMNQARQAMGEFTDRFIDSLAKAGGPIRPAAPQTAGRSRASPPAGFVHIPGGTFTMGSPPGEPDRGSDEGPQHQVTVRSFYMAKYEVTQKEWQDVMGNNPSNFKGDNQPVECVSWNDAVEYCNKRSVQEGLTPVYSGSGDAITCNWNANGYRLPTEAEWEYAAKGGNKDALTYLYSGSNSIDAVAWHSGNRGWGTHPVGQKAPNSLGIYDMSGNVWEWCWDWYGSYSSGAQTDPQGPSSGSARVFRGGSWSGSAGGLRSAGRYGHTPSGRSDDLGFRLVRPEC
jgi:formylglycine-generating enzyme required for sulfatase activity